MQHSKHTNIYEYRQYKKRITGDRRISIRGQIVAKTFCAVVKIVAKQSTTGCYGVDSIVRCLRRNTPPSPGIARSLCSNTTSRSVARSLCRNTPLSPAVARYLYSNTTASRGSSAETLHATRCRAFPLQKHPAVTRHRAVTIVTPRHMSGWQTSGGRSHIWRVVHMS